MNKKISIILCTYNEVNYIEQALSLISKTIENVEIIIVDDNSHDGTLEKLDKLKSMEREVEQKTITLQELVGKRMDQLSTE